MTRTSPTRTLFQEQLSTPTGQMLLLTDEQGRVRALDWSDQIDRLRHLLRLQYGVGGTSIIDRPTPSDARLAVTSYFEGDLTAVDQLAVATAGTAFQREVWAALRTIPAGQTRSYGVLAATIGRPRAVRAVGLANGSNVIGIVVPCHRVIGADASLTGYGGGLARKRWLLEHEGALPTNSRQVAGRAWQPDLITGEARARKP
jgi:methylated-DNA-[protein]-cysteine S-methyltransferase